MTDSMIPYSFMPGTKAKADEVNANFIALANTIETNRLNAAGDIENVNEVLATKADKTELVNEYIISETGKNLNDYKTNGTYIFTSTYTPYNIPKGNQGTLIVTGKNPNFVKQIWMCTETNPEIFTRNFTNSSWSEWQSITGKLNKSDPGYFRLPNGFIIQWGGQPGSNVTYPIAFSQVACPVCYKKGWNASYERSDSGILSPSLTGFDYASGGYFLGLNWIAIGF